MAGIQDDVAATADTPYGDRRCENAEDMQGVPLLYLELREGVGREGPTNRE